MFLRTNTHNTDQDLFHQCHAYACNDEKPPAGLGTELAPRPHRAAADDHERLRSHADLVRGGFADVGLLHGSQDLTGLDTEDLLVERQSVVPPSAHRLAGRADVTPADLEDEPLARFPGRHGAVLSGAHGTQEAFRGRQAEVDVAVRGRRCLMFGMPGSCCS